MKKFLIYNQEIENEKTKLAETDPIIERLKSPLEEKSFYYKLKIFLNFKKNMPKF